MGILRSLFFGEPDPLVRAVLDDSGPQFAVDATAIDPAVFGLTAYASPTSYAPRIDRRGAMQVPAVKRSRDLIAGSIGTLPIDLIDPSKKTVRSDLFEQPEKNVPRSVTMTRTVEDLLFEGIAWWRVVEFSWTNYPRYVKRINPREVSVNEDTGEVFIKGKRVPDEELIRFDSPNDPLLIAGARAIRTCLSLDAAAQRYADEPMPSGYFSPAENADPADDNDVKGLLNDWQTARQTRTTGYVPAALKYNTVAFSAEDIQLADARQHAVLEIARIAGIDPEELGVSTTSRTYQNQQDRRKDFVDFTLGAYINAIQDRLSMGDVTPRGYYARMNLDYFLRSDAKTRFDAYEVGLRVGALAKEEIRELEDKPALSESQKQEVAEMAAGQEVQETFDTEPEIRLDATGAEVFSVDVEKRVIKGLLVPYGKPGISNGQVWQFSKGVLKFADPSRVKLWIQHDSNRAVGFAQELDDRDDGLYGTFKVARGPAGDEALSLAEDKVLDGFSIGLGRGVKVQRDRNGVNHVSEAPLMETSLTPAPSFDDARVHEVAASAANQRGNAMPCEKCGKVHATGVVECNAEDVAKFEAEKSGVDFSAVTDAITRGFEGLLNPQNGGREKISAGHEVEVKEDLPYRFDGIAGEHSFIEDMRDAQQGNPDARTRLEKFGDDVGSLLFAVTTGNVSALNPTGNRPDLYVPNLSYSRPLWDSVSTGVINDKTPFTVPKFVSAGTTKSVSAVGTTLGSAALTGTGFVAGDIGAAISGAGIPAGATLIAVNPGVGATLSANATATGTITVTLTESLATLHTEGVEPSYGAFTATTQTVSPTPISGKVEINREVLDQGGSPQADQIIWNEMLNAYFEALESMVARTLASTATTALALAGAVDSALVDAMVNHFAGLQFVRGGNRYTGLALDGQLFPALVAAKDSSGRKLLPVLGPQNAQGQTDGAFDRVMIGSQTGRAAWALGSTAGKSYSFVPSSVYAWASAPKRFTFEYQVKSVDMAVWGYGASAILRDSDVKPITR